MKSMVNSALQDLIELEKETRAFGFDWETAYQILDQVMDECREIRQSLELQEGRARVQEEIGDLMHAAISLCLYSGFDVEETLSQVNQKFGGRMQRVRRLAAEQGLASLKDQSWEQMMHFWNQAKQAG